MDLTAEVVALRNQKLSWPAIAYILNNKHDLELTESAYRRRFERYNASIKKSLNRPLEASIAEPFDGPKILIFDIETAPMLGYVWSLWENTLGLNQVEQDWYILSWAAKWNHENEVMYMDQRNAKNIEDDKKLLQQIWKLLDEADIVVTQNGKKFDVKKLNARFILNGMQRPSQFKHIDTKILAGRHFAFTSNKLEYLTDKLCVKYKKLKHAKFSGFSLWKECLAGNSEAWQEMEEYNKYDVLSLEELYTKLIGWDGEINYNVYRNNTEYRCNCGSNQFTKHGFLYTNTGKFQRYECKNCGLKHSSKINLLSKEKRQQELKPMK